MQSIRFPSHWQSPNLWRQRRLGRYHKWKRYAIVAFPQKWAVVMTIPQFWNKLLNRHTSTKNSTFVPTNEKWCGWKDRTHISDGWPCIFHLLLPSSQFTSHEWKSLLGLGGSLWRKILKEVTRLKLDLCTKMYNNPYGLSSRNLLFQLPLMKYSWLIVTDEANSDVSLLRNLFAIYTKQRDSTINFSQFREFD
jgi:hypothetical protein